MTVFCSWSGGKESSLALNRAIKQGLEIDCLVTMLPVRGSTIGHGLPLEFYRMQARSMGLEIRYAEADWAGYEKKFTEIVEEIRPDKGIFGDVYISDHKRWVEEKAKELGFEALEPLWGDDSEKVYEEFLDEGFEGIIVKLNPKKVSANWLGHPVDKQFLKYLKGTKFVQSARMANSIQRP